jgi:hypothetical protein
VIATRASLAAVTLLLAVACSDDDPSAAGARADQVREAVLEAGLDEDVAEDVAEVVALAARGADGTFRVTYDAADRTVTITQRPPDRRIDSVDADGTLDSTITVAGRTHACTDPAGEEEGPRCEPLGEPPPSGVFDDAAVDELVEDLRLSTEDHDFAVEEQEVAGTDVRCLVTTPREGAGQRAPARLCVAGTGAILLVERPAGTLRASEHSTDVPDDAFELPA